MKALSRTITVFVVLVTLAPAASVRAGGPKTAPTSAPAVAPAVMKILKGLEAAGRTYATIRATADYEVVNRSLGDSEARTGWVAYRGADPNAKAPAKFHIRFETLKLGAGRKIRARREFIFDGEWLADLNHRTKAITLFQLAAKGQPIQPLRIGKGPFPLPFGQKVADVLEHFECSTRPPTQYDPNDTVFLRLTRRPKHAKTVAAERVDLWIDRKTHLPVKVKSRDDSRNITTVVFKDVRTNRKEDEKLFVIPKKPGWQRVVRPLKGGDAPRP
jgi:hypothetical protein